MKEEAYKTISGQALQDFLDKGKGVVLDVLVPEHYAGRHIPGAQNACVYEMNFIEQVVQLAPDKAAPMVVYGAGPDSRDCFVAAEKLVRAGYAKVSLFPGGLKTWRREGRPLEGEAPTETDPPHPELVLDKDAYSLVPEQSAIQWWGRNPNGSHTGLLKFLSGDLANKNGKLSGGFILDMTSLVDLDLAGDELKPVLEAHLKSDDFFFTELFPQARFSITGTEPIDDAPATMPNYLLSGILDLRGVQREITFPAHIRTPVPGRVVVMAHYDLDRTKWGVIYGSARYFQHLGYHLVFDMITVDIRLVLV